MRHAEISFLTPAVAGDAVSGPISRRSALHEQISPVLLGDHTGSGPQGPTGQVANTNTSSFLVDGVPARFIFANLNGTISAWNGVGTTAIIQPTTGRYGPGPL